jgi:hypothetical protein
MTHSFQFDPSTILGVPSGATLQEIRDAYHQKSLKYHPDKGGDEWAFRMVARAYEILSTARVVERASDEVARPASPSPSPAPQADPDPEPRATWAEGFDPASAFVPPAPEIDPASMVNLKGWGSAPRSHDGEPPGEVARIVLAELLILRFEFESSLDLFARSPEDRNLSCSIHVSWPVDELADLALTIPDAARTLKKIGEAFKARGVRKHSLNKRSTVAQGRFEGWLTYPTAVMASEALEAFREALAPHGLLVEKDVREMAIPRPRG